MLGIGKRIRMMDNKCPIQPHQVGKQGHYIMLNQLDHYELDVVQNGYCWKQCMTLFTSLDSPLRQLSVQRYPLPQGSQKHDSAPLEVHSLQTIGRWLADLAGEKVQQRLQYNLGEEMWRTINKLHSQCSSIQHNNDNFICLSHNICLNISNSTVERRLSK